MKVYLKVDEEPWFFLGDAKSIDFRQTSLPTMSFENFLKHKENLQPTCYIDLKNGNLNKLYALAKQSEHIYRFKLCVISEGDERNAALFTFDTLKGWQNVFGDYTICFTPLAQTNNVTEVVKEIGRE